MALAILALLVWLFLRPVQPAHEIVFGSLGHRTVSSNGVTGRPISAPPPSSQIPGSPSNAPADSAMAPPPENVESNAMASSNSAVTGPFTNEAAQNGVPPSSPPAENPSPASNSPPVMQASSPPPPATYMQPDQNTHLNGAIYDDPWRADPSSKASTSRLLAEAKAASMARDNPADSRTADMLGNDTGPRPWFDPRAGTNVVFILDNSMNMMTNGKSFFARQELVSALRSMQPAQLFYVLLFHTGGYEGMPSLGPVPATQENVRAMTNWLFSVGHRTGADPSKAMQRAMTLSPAPDAAWLLSGSTLPSDAVDNTRDANAGPNARINTVNLYSRDGEEALRRIADENRGAYRFVPPPPANLASP